MLSCNLCRAAANATSSVVSALSLDTFTHSVTSRKLHAVSVASSVAVGTSTGRRLHGSLASEGDTLAYITATSSNSTMVVYDIAAGSPTSRAITSEALTFGQAQLLLSEATTLENEVLAIAAIAVCGNGVCELGERANATAAGVNATGTSLKSV